MLSDSVCTAPPSYFCGPRRRARAVHLHHPSMAAFIFPPCSPVLAAAETTSSRIFSASPRTSVNAPLNRSCLAATGRWEGSLGPRKCSTIVHRSSAVRVSPLEAEETRIFNGSVNPIIVIDNYDSFTYNLCQYMGELGANFEVYRNDELTVEEMQRKKPRGILISPGPGTPQDSGISLQTVRNLGPSTPLFGVCMGLQCIGEAFGGKIVRSPYGVVHGKGSLVHYDEKGQDGLFTGLPNPFIAGRYHSLVIENGTFPSDALEITAWTEDGLIMAARHKEYTHIQGVQFHPESIITKEGKTMVLNFIKLIERFEAMPRIRAQ